MKLDFYCKVLQDGALSVLDADRLIEIMKEGGLCILPSDSSYMLTGNIMIKGIAEDINFLLGRPRTNMSLSFHDFDQFLEAFELSDMARDFISKLMPGGLTFVSQPTDDVTGNRFARILNTDGTIGIRLSDSRAERQLAKAFPIPTVPIRKPSHAETGTLDDALQIIGDRFGKLNKYRYLAGVDGPVLHCGEVSTVVKEEEINDSWHIIILRKGIISVDEIKSAAMECKYAGIVENE